MPMCDVLEEPTGSLYRRLLSYAQRECRFALLVIRHSISMNESGIEVLAQLEQYKISAIEANEWPGTRLLDHTATVLTYRYEESFVILLQALTDHLYGWQQPDLPEDLCLLRSDGSPWLVTIAHEAESYFLLTEEETIALSSSLPDLRISETPALH